MANYPPSIPECHLSTRDEISIRPGRQAIVVLTLMKKLTGTIEGRKSVKGSSRERSNVSAPKEM